MSTNFFFGIILLSHFQYVMKIFFSNKLQWRISCLVNRLWSKNASKTLTPWLATNSVVKSAPDYTTNPWWGNSLVPWGVRCVSFVVIWVSFGECYPKWYVSYMKCHESYQNTHGTKVALSMVYINNIKIWQLHFTFGLFF